MSDIRYDQCKTTVVEQYESLTELMKSGNPLSDSELVAFAERQPAWAVTVRSVRKEYYPKMSRQKDMTTTEILAKLVKAEKKHGTDPSRAAEIKRLKIQLKNGG